MNVSPSDPRKVGSPGDVTRVGVVGLGYWGPNLARNLEALDGVQLAWCCDERAEVRERLASVPLALDLRGVTRRAGQGRAVLL